jgi:putative membrane protein
MVLQSLAGLPAFLVYFSTGVLLVIAYVYIYTWITHHDEFDCIRKNVPGAAVALGLSVIGFALPVSSAMGHAANVVDCLIWGIIALAVQILVYYLARIPVPNLSQRITDGELAPAIWLGLASVTGGVISASAMSL